MREVRWVGFERDLQSEETRGRDRGEKCPVRLSEESNINIFLIAQKRRGERKILWRNVVGVEERETFKKILGSPKLLI
jgi:hypothetical protein